MSKVLSCVTVLHILIEWHFTMIIFFLNFPINFTSTGLYCIYVGACGQVDRVLDSQCWPCLDVWANFVFHTALDYPDVMGTWCTEPRFYQ